MCKYSRTKINGSEMIWRLLNYVHHWISVFILLFSVQSSCCECSFNFNFFKDRKPFYYKIYTLINEMLSLSPVAEFNFLWQLQSNDSLQMAVFNKEESLWEGGGERSTVCDSPNVVFNIRSVCVLSRCQLALPIRQNSLRSQFMTSTLE